MRVRNVHERVIRADFSEVGRLLDTLGGEDDRLWPVERWPGMRFDRGLAVGARGGHGPIRYHVVAYEPGRRVRFRFVAPPGFNGTHEYEVEARGEKAALLRHTLTMDTSWPATASWPIVFRWLHDALIEDSLDRAESMAGGAPRRRTLSLWVRCLRRLMRGRPRAADRKLESSRIGER